MAEFQRALQELAREVLADWPHLVLIVVGVWLLLIAVALTH